MTAPVGGWDRNLITAGPGSTPVGPRGPAPQQRIQVPLESFRSRAVDPGSYWSVSQRGPQPKRSKKIAVFDFDQTLAADEITIWGWDNIVDRGFGGAERVSMLREMLAALHEDNVGCSVVSFNTKVTIERALSAIDLLKFFKRELIFGRDIIDWPAIQWRKSTVIAQRIILPSSLSESDVRAPQPAHRPLPTAPPLPRAARRPRPRVLAPSRLTHRARTAAQVCFADDDPNNILDVASVLPGVCAIHVPRVQQTTPFVASVAKPKGGMQRVHVDRVLRWAAEASASGASAANPKEMSKGHHVNGRTVPPIVSAFLGAVSEEEDGIPEPPPPPERSRLTGGPCECFVPKRPSGPLANRCNTCGEHIEIHTNSIHGPIINGSVVVVTG
jgi:hypothetical protein